MPHRPRQGPRAAPPPRGLPGWRPSGAGSQVTSPRHRPSPGLFRPEEEELVAGRRPVEEAFVARRTAHRLLIVPQRRQALERIVLHATSLRIPIVEVEGGTLTAIAGFDGHQGVALAVAPRRFADLDEILARALERGEPALLLALDSLEDPQNVGTLLRSAEGAGVHGVVFPARGQAPLSAAAVKASAGATEHLLLARVDDLAGSLADLRARGLRVVGAEAAAPLEARQADLRGPLVIVVGSEGHGLSPSVRRRCDLTVRIPLRGTLSSLNAAVAGSILIFEAVNQRSVPGEPGRAPASGATGEPPGTTGATTRSPGATGLAPGTASGQPVDAVEHGAASEAPSAKQLRRAPEVSTEGPSPTEVRDPDLLPGEPPRSSTDGGRSSAPGSAERVQKRP